MSMRCGRSPHRDFFVVALFVCIAGASSKEVCSHAQQLQQHELSVAKSLLARIPVPVSEQPAPFIHVGGCLRQPQGWWSYEFCPGKWIRQYHEEQNKVLSEYFLGFGPHALDDDEIGRQPIRYQGHVTPLLTKLGEDKSFRFHTEPLPAAHARCRTKNNKVYWPPQVVADYIDGTVCDATNAPRRTVVIYVCDWSTAATVPTLMWNITEHASCQYTIFVVGSVACEMMNVKRSHDGNAAAAGATAPAAQQKPGGASGKASDVRPHPARRRKLTELMEQSKDEVAPGVAPSADASVSTDSPTAAISDNGETQNDPSEAQDTQEQVVRSQEGRDAPISESTQEELNFEDYMIFAV